MLSPDRDLAAALRFSAAQDARTKNQDRAQHNQAAGLRKGANAVDDVVCDNFMQLIGPGQGTSANNEQDNADKEICKFFHYGVPVE